MSTKRHPGIVIKVGERELVVPPLTLGQIEANAEKLAAIDQIETSPQKALATGAMGKVLDLIVLAVQRNYPDMKREEIGELVDMHNLRQFLPAILGASEGEAKGLASV